jgi:hypothetical protein
MVSNVMTGVRTGIRFVAVLGAVLALGACGSVRDAVGIDQDPPDEFKVTVRAPLSMPADFGLKAPTPGSNAVKEEGLRDRTRQIVLDATGKPKATAVADDPLVRGVSPSEAALLRRLGADEVDPNIRQVVERETTAIELESKNFVEDLMFWKNKEPPAKVVDADAERRRIQGNAALGKDTTSGLTPDISRKKSGGLLHNLF